MSTTESNSSVQRLTLQVPTHEECIYYSNIKPEYDSAKLDPRIGMCVEPAIFLIKRIEDGEFIGICNFYNRNGTAVEIGICIPYKKHWGYGYGREAVRLLCRFLYESLGIRVVFLKTPVLNRRAIDCYLDCGFNEWFKGYMENHNMLFMIKKLTYENTR